MKTELQKSLSKSALAIRFHLTDGSVHSFNQSDGSEARRIWESVEPARLFAPRRIVIGSEHSKAVFVCSEIVRVDFIENSFQCWDFPGGYSDIIELSQEEFRKYAYLDQSALMPKRVRPAPVGDLFISFSKLQMKGSHPLHVMVEAQVKVAAESQSFMQFMLSKAVLHMRLRGGGIGVVNLANLVAYTVYPGVPQIPADSWLAEPAMSLSLRNEITT